MTSVLLHVFGGKNVTEDQLLIKFKAKDSISESDSPPEKKEEKETKEQRIKEANAFWSAFFKVHSDMNSNALKKKRKDKKRK